MQYILLFRVYSMIFLGEPIIQTRLLKNYVVDAKIRLKQPEKKKNKIKQKRQHPENKNISVASYPLICTYMYIYIPICTYGPLPINMYL